MDSSSEEDISDDIIFRRRAWFFESSAAAKGPSRSTRHNRKKQRTDGRANNVSGSADTANPSSPVLPPLPPLLPTAAVPPLSPPLLPTASPSPVPSPPPPAQDNLDLVISDEAFEQMFECVQHSNIASNLDTDTITDCEQVDEETDEVVTEYLQGNFDVLKYIEQETETDESSSVNFDAIVNNIKSSLFEGSSHSTDEAVLMLMDLYVNNRNVTKKLLGSIAHLISVLLPQPNAFPSNKYLLLKYVSDRGPTYSAIVHEVCKKCDYYVGVRSSSDAQCRACRSKEMSLLYEFPLEEIIKHLFEVRNLKRDLCGRESAADDCLRDITDGSIYRSFADQMGPYDLTLLWNTDGVSVSNSSGAQLWPLQFTICEVSPKLRKCYLTVCGFFFGSSKPCLNSFLKPFVMSVRKICTEGGVKWNDPDCQEERTSMIRAPFASMDAPARAAGLHMTNVGVFFPCIVCYVKGGSVPHIRGHKVAYPLLTDEPILRLAAEIREEALRSSRAFPIHGLFGPCVASFIPRFNYARSLPSEYLHNTLLGVVRSFGAVWLTDHRGKWYIKSQLSTIDEFLLSIYPPDTVTRTPRSLQSWPQWKGSEWLYWLLFYSVPALEKIRTIDSEFGQHWLLLVKSIYNLLLEEIKPNHIEESKVLLKLFVKEIKELYSYREAKKDTPRSEWKMISGDWLYTFNVHQLLHLPLVVEDTGPLWATSAFVFEDNNGNLANLIHGTNNIDKELLNSLQLLESIRVLRRKVLEKIGPDAEVLGDVAGNHGCSINLDKAEIQKMRLLVGNNQLTASDCHVYSRVAFKGKMYSSRSWTLPEKRNSFTVKVSCGTRVIYGEMLYFVQIDDVKDVFCVVESFEIDHRSMIVHKATRTILKHLLPVKEKVYGERIVCSLRNVTSRIIRVGKYLGVPPNQIEINL